MKLCLALLPALFSVSLSAFADDDKPTINVDLQTREVISTTVWIMRYDMMLRVLRAIIFC